MTAPEEREMLRVEKVSVDFGAFRALTDVSLTVGPGEVVGVIGPNGAGKSTLVNALSGVVAPSAGSVLLRGRALGRARPVRRARLGLVRTFQTAQLFGSLTVRSNIDLARRGSARADLVDAATELLRLDPVLDLAADRLSGGQRKLVEFVRALAARPEVLLLDEPVAGVPMHDRVRVLDLIRRHLADSRGSVVLIEHDMEFVSSVCDRIYVMNAGAVIAQGTWADISSDPAVLEAYLGSAPTAPTAPTGAEN
ncbi:ABC transporter ATP-binding protein [Pseudonocardia sp. WMMC193]|uniref:ABC transporter ATP-binding protein n=1 Tax=Pseudonocardia sp. WMMC193 TaxID=2911965 RepID=UPI001F25823E|nr:ABC transporter ATP-binding protein [Pseudonocardia sp. WMMC193]MCF7553692.1 ABC transporter ATP-binding protein [Pseudonocardia sp. WMMC193]